MSAFIKTFDIILPVGEDLEKVYNGFKVLSSDKDVPSVRVRVHRYVGFQNGKQVPKGVHLVLSL